MSRFVLPRAATPSGGHRYNARVARALRELGNPIDVLELEGAWPRPDDAARQRLAAALSEAELTLLDGLIGCCCPAQIEQATAAGRTVVLLVHLPLPAEVGLGAQEPHDLARWERRALTAASRVVATSNWAARDLWRRYGVRAAVAVPGVDIAPVAVGSDPPHLLVLSSLTPRKNHATLVRALADLTDLDWSAAFVGPPSGDPREARELAAVLQATPPGRVRMPGALTGAALEQEWARTDLLVLPSLAETFGMVITEAHAHGIPTLVADGTGAVEAFHGDDPAGAPGLAVDCRASGDIAAALRDWLVNPQTRARWRDRALVRRDRLHPWHQTALDLQKELA
ncbi:glycosyltransferase family 4 protein [Gephyromycinifex aptenodytis]|uniref:glycosyltransferase family 4 protein n=1 Tax=Gephyromycinifex aptenodytis TaxID=2716227 RepID=UPI0014480797|nr:glycosyltransferase family 4 protein [Gephyromycinifex aptenodytis]